MKFAKELEDNLVPEWRAKYFDYKAGKKKVKAVAKALRNIDHTPRTPGRQLPANFLSAPAALPPPVSVDFKTSNFPPTVTRPPGHVSAPVTPDPSRRSLYGEEIISKQVQAKTAPLKAKVMPDESSPLANPLRISEVPDNEPSPLWDSGAVTKYGSIKLSPPADAAMHHPPSLELPDPALSADEESFASQNPAWRHSRLNPKPINPTVEGDVLPAAGRSQQGVTGSKESPVRSKGRKFFKPHRAASTPAGVAAPSRPPLLRRLFSTAGLDSPRPGYHSGEAYKDFDLRQAEFLKFLGKELDKIESFYRMKETQATDRLRVLRQQLHVMRDRRLEEVQEAQRSKQRASRDYVLSTIDNGEGPSSEVSSGNERPTSAALKWISPLDSIISVGGPHFGKNTKALQQMDTSPLPAAQEVADRIRKDSWRDFSRRPVYHDDVPYRSAKRKLKLALQEYYRGLELLKSYALLNRTAFRKINKKYDKAVKARPTGRYMSEKVNKAWFVQSEVLEGLIVATEDLYARYFERGHHKIAVGKLRSKTLRVGEFTGSIFRNGLFIAGGLVLGIQGVVYGAEHLYSLDMVVVTNASYLLQIYGAYFLALLLFLLFCIDCMIWSSAKINYVFIFEFDTRHNLDWRQLAELPCCLFFLLGLFIWLNFHPASSGVLFLYWPVLLVAISAFILFVPAPVLYHRSREWWAYSNFRLLLAGLYPVEFRDFFLGDMYCSQTYFMGNLELLICLYARHWNEPVQCNSSHSRWLGFLSTLPGIWRALQCLRRYYDTRNAFPHLVNFGKYTFTILFYMTLSLYRINTMLHLKALFITCATINAIYCSIWDLAMDWSLCNPYAPNPFLRDVLGYKRAWVYYAAMVLDPLLRFNWIFYAIYSHDLQHSALLSFGVSLSEVCRRGIWSLFRVENEHCTNVGRFRASRDVPLPYDIQPPSETASLKETEVESLYIPTEIAGKEHRREPPARPTVSQAASGVDAEQALGTPASGSLRRRPAAPAGNAPIQRGIARVGTIMTEAHAQDFERKRRPGMERPSSRYEEQHMDSGESSDENEEEELETTLIDREDIADAQGILRRQRDPAAFHSPSV